MDALSNEYMVVRTGRVVAEGDAETFAGEGRKDIVESGGGKPAIDARVIAEWQAGVVVEDQGIHTEAEMDVPEFEQYNGVGIRLFQKRPLGQGKEW